MGRGYLDKATESVSGWLGMSDESGDQATDFGSNADRQAEAMPSPRDAVVAMLEDGIPDWDAFCEVVDALPDRDWQQIMANPVWEAVYDEAALRNSGEATEVEPAADAEPEAEPAADVAGGGADEAAAQAADDLPPAALSEAEVAGPSAPPERIYGSDPAVMAELTQAQAAEASWLVHEIERYAEYLPGDAEIYADGKERVDTKVLGGTARRLGGAQPSRATSKALGIEADHPIIALRERGGSIDADTFDIGWVWNTVEGTLHSVSTYHVQPDGRADLAWDRKQTFDIEWSAEGRADTKPTVTVKMSNE